MMTYRDDYSNERKQMRYDELLCSAEIGHNFGGRQQMMEPVPLETLACLKQKLLASPLAFQAACEPEVAATAVLESEPKSCSWLAASY